MTIIFCGTIGRSGLGGDVQGGRCDHRIQLHSLHVVVREPGRRAEALMGAACRIPENQTAVRTGEDDSPIRQCDQVADVSLGHSDLGHRVVNPKGLTIPDRDAVSDVLRA